MRQNVSLSKRIVLGSAGIGSAVLLAITVGVLPALASNSSSQWLNGASVQVATIQQRQASVTIPMGNDIHLLPNSIAVCTLQSDPGGRAISYVKVNYSKNSLTVYLDGTAQKAIQVACVTTPVNGGSVSGPVSGPWAS